MIISCGKCNKKFEISDNLIPDEGRLVECGSCTHQWHFYPSKKIKLVNEVENFDKSKSKKKKIIKQDNEEIFINKKKDFVNSGKLITKKSKKVGFLSYLLAIIISLIALIAFLDTFNHFSISFLPNTDFYLSSLYESLTDIFLFFKDLIK